MKEALGLVETRGLVAAIFVSDTMAKTANIKIIGIENTKGLGYMTIKISGDVGAVNAAVTSGKQIAIENNAFVSAKVIPRPSDIVESVFCQPEKKEINEGKDVNDSILELIDEEVTKETENLSEDSKNHNKESSNEESLNEKNETYLNEDIIKEDTEIKSENIAINNDKKPTKRTTKRKADVKKE